MKTIKLSAFFLLMFGSVIISSATAQSRKSRNAGGVTTPVRVGSVILNLGVGAGSEYKNDYYGSAFGTKMALEFGLWQAGPGVITLGAEAGGTFSNGGYYDNYKARTIVLAARSAWHYGWKVRGLDTYGGFSAGLGFHHYNYRRNEYYDYNEVIPVIGAFIGASYFVTPRFGFNAEAGYDITNAQIGVVFKLK